MKQAPFRAVAAAPDSIGPGTGGTALVAVLVAVCTLAPVSARAEASAAPAASVAGAGSVIEVPRFRGALDDYRSYRSEPVASWPDSNERVGRIGGWRVYAREAFAPAPPSVPAATERREVGGPGAGAASGGGR